MPHGWAAERRRIDAQQVMFDALHRGMDNDLLERSYSYLLEKGMGKTADFVDFIALLRRYSAETDEQNPNGKWIYVASLGILAAKFFPEQAEVPQGLGVELSDILPSLHDLGNCWDIVRWLGKLCSLDSLEGAWSKRIELLRKVVTVVDKYVTESNAGTVQSAKAIGVVVNDIILKHVVVGGVGHVCGTLF